MRHHFSRYTKYVLGLFVFIFALSLIHWTGDSGFLRPGVAEAKITQETRAVVSKDNPLIRAAIEVQNRHTEVLMGISGVVGTATGIAPDGQPVIKVLTTRAGIPGIPKSLDGIPVEVKVTGMIVAFSYWSRPVPIGVSTGNEGECSAGTIGCRVTDGTDVYALSNNHVYALENEAELGSEVLQPGLYDTENCGYNSENVIGYLYDFEPIVFSRGAKNTMDAAIALSSEDLLSNATPPDGYGMPSSTIYGDGNNDGFFDDIDALLNLRVQKYGRTTALTNGTISDVNETVNVCYECADLFCFRCNKWARFKQQIGISGEDFSSPGDSGSLIVTQDGNNPVGLLFAGSPTYTVANRIDLVLDRFNVSIDGAAAEPVTDVAVTGVSAPDLVVQGDVVNVDVMVENVDIQDVTSDIDVTLTDDTDGETIDSETISGGLAAGTSMTVSFSWDTTGASIGDHTLTATHNFSDDDSDNDSKSTTVTVTEPTGVTVDSINPNTMPAGTTTDVTITGSGFVAGADVTFENGDGPAPITSNVVFVDADTITATVTAKRGGPRRNRIWDVRVTNPDGSSGVLDDGGFTVTPNRVIKK